MSESSEKPSSLICEMYACRSTLALAEGSSTLSLTGMGTRSTRRASSCFSSSRTVMLAKSLESEKRRRSSMSLSVGLRYSLYTWSGVRGKG